MINLKLRGTKTLACSTHQKGETREEAKVCPNPSALYTLYCWSDCFGDDFDLFSILEYGGFIMTDDLYLWKCASCYELENWDGMFCSSKALPKLLFLCSIYFCRKENKYYNTLKYKLWWISIWNWLFFLAKCFKSYKYPSMVGSVFHLFNF